MSHDDLLLLVFVNVAILCAGLYGCLMGRAFGKAWGRALVEYLKSTHGAGR